MDIEHIIAVIGSLPLLMSLGGVSVLAASIALGIRHGIDWDHIAAITDITSTSATSHAHEDAWLVREPGVQLTDESHHDPHDPPVVGAHSHAAEETQQHRTHEHRARREEAPVALSMQLAAGAGAYGGGTYTPVGSSTGSRVGRIAREQRPSLVLGTMYALGHGSVVFVLGALALLAGEFLPNWIDPIMERIVGFTLLFLAFYLFYALYRYFRGGGEFKLRSRWMLVFAGVRNAWESLRSKVFGVEREHVHASEQYGLRTALGIGMIHGIGAETGTQVLVITAAAGAGSKTMGLLSLLFFIAGLLISNSIVTVMTTVGFTSSRQKNAFYIAAGLLAAVFSLVVGIVFLTRSTDFLPSLDQYFRWIGGGST